MDASWIGFITLICVIVSQTASASNTSEENDCECITKWTTPDLNCSSSDIATLQSYLTLNRIHCSESCIETIACQQAVSLLTQYYNYCALGTVSHAVISAFCNSSCADCGTNTKYTEPDIPSCITTRCNHHHTSTSVHYLETNCSIADTQCTTACQHHWDVISSFQRQCVPYPLDYLYTQSSSNCQKDCTVPMDTEYTTHCPNALYTNYPPLDIQQLEQETKLCFYGLNINDPTSYDLVCVERSNLNRSGIVSYSAIPKAQNESFWSAFSFAYDLDLVWMLCCAAIIFFMQLGFTLLEAGSVKAGNVQNILFKNIMDAAICALVYYILGYCVAYGDPTSPNANGFMGVGNILIETENWGHWFFQMSFACTASTIVSGAVAERLRLEPYFIYTIIVSAWIYPVVVHWIWSETGWISTANPNPALYAGAIDFAGSSVVHMIGGFVGLCGAYFVGPRLRRFDESQAAKRSKYYKELKHQFEFGHNVPFQVMGLFILWFGFYGFNPGSTLQAQGSMHIASKVAVNTTLSAAAGGITSALVAKYTTGEWHIPKLCNGLLSALASITASCAVVDSGWAIVIGVIGSLLYYVTSSVMVNKYVQIDDPLDAFAVHGVSGAWGVLSASLFSTSESLKAANYPEALYAGTTVWERIATNVTLIVVVAGWTLLNGGVLFGFMGWLGILRVSEHEERAGLDVCLHGGTAVNMRKTYAVSVKSTIYNKKKYHRARGDSEETAELDIDGNFGIKIRESSLEKRMGNIAESDEHDSVFPT